MAENTLQAESESAKQAYEIHELGLKIQDMAQRIKSLARATDRELDMPTDTPEERDLIGRATDFCNIIQETAAQVIDLGEKVEILSGNIERAMRSER